MPLIWTLPLAAALIAVGTLLVLRGRDKQRYLMHAAKAGIDVPRVEELYDTYRTNRSLAGNLAIWLGVGLLVASALA